MGDGLVLEQGTHNDLISKDGAYALLVSTQKLREAKDQEAGADSDDTGSNGDEPQDMEKAAREEVPLGRRNTGHSLASEILEKKKQEQGEKGEDDDFSMPYLLKRMALINRPQWTRYAIGFVFASMTGMVYPAFGIVFGSCFS